ncbi:hypothetical protein CYMTET_28516, partial [Cymbomonas tetramitiformis]
DAFEDGTLERIRAIEDVILEDSQYAEYCLLAWDSSALALQDDQHSQSEPVRAAANLGVRALNENGASHCSPPASALWACNPTRLLGTCEEQAAQYRLDPPGLLYCSADSEGYDEARGCRRSQMSLQHTVNASDGFGDSHHSMRYKDWVLQQYSRRSPHDARATASLQQFYHYP